MPPPAGQSTAIPLLRPSATLPSSGPKDDARLRLHSTMHAAHGPEPFPAHMGSPIQGTVGGGVKKCPIQLKFPCFGRMEDDTDPLTYLEQCRDYLALSPLSDEELLATLRNVLFGTARDWWDVVRLETITWREFEQKFLSAFLSEDYMDELEERIRTRVQREGESIRDFAYMFRALCRRWNPDITEAKVIQLILKSIHPSLASQLRSSGVKTVDSLVRLGQQLEKDKEKQSQQEATRKHTTAAS